MSRRGECHPKEGDWVILKDDNIIACDDNPKRLMDMIFKSSDSTLVLSKQPSSNNCYY